MWWLVLLLLGVPDLVRIAAHAWFVHVRHVFDHRIPDDLPVTAGQWLATKIEQLGLSDRVKVRVTSHAAHARNAFHIARGVIQLTEETSCKHDPTFWAIAAHELGHARMRLARPGWTAFSRVAEVTKRFLVKLGIGIAAGNVLFALPHATRIAYVMLVAALVLTIIDLVDEIGASALAMSMLREEPALTDLHLRVARSALSAAFTTYLAPVLVYGGLLTQWWIVERLTAVPRVPSGGATMFGMVIAAIASAYILLFAVTHVLAAVRSPSFLHAESVLFSVVWTVAVAALVVIGWDRHATAAHAWTVMLAVAEIHVLVRLMLELPTDIATLPLLRWLRRFDRGIEKTAAFWKAKAAAVSEIHAGNRWAAGAFAEDAARVTLARRIWELHRLLVLPLLLSFWL